MRLYYYKPTHTPSITIQTEIDIKPHKNSSVAACLAYAIQQASRPRLIAEARREVFINHMLNNAGTRELLKQTPLGNVDFNAPDLVEELAQHFILSVQDINDLDAEEEKEEKYEISHNMDFEQEEKRREEKVLAHFQNSNIASNIHTCPFSLFPIRHGIKFLMDPNWYEISYALAWIKKSKSDKSPMTTERWSVVEDYESFNFPGGPEEYNYVDNIIEIMWEIFFSPDLSSTPHFPDIQLPPKPNPVINEQRRGVDFFFLEALFLLHGYTNEEARALREVMERDINILNQRIGGYFLILQQLLPALRMDLRRHAEHVLLQHDLELANVNNAIRPFTRVMEYLSQIFGIYFLIDELFTENQIFLLGIISAMHVTTFMLNLVRQNNDAHHDEQEEQPRPNTCFTRVSAAAQRLGGMVNNHVVTPLWQAGMALSNGLHHTFFGAPRRPQSEDRNHLHFPPPRRPQ